MFITIILPRPHDLTKKPDLMSEIGLLIQHVAAATCDRWEWTHRQITESDGRSGWLQYDRGRC